MGGGQETRKCLLDRSLYLALQMEILKIVITVPSLLLRLALRSSTQMPFPIAYQDHSGGEIT